MKYIHLDGKVRIVFVFQVASFWTSWESLYEACRADGRFDVRLAWIDDISSGDAAQMRTAEAFLKERRIPYERFDPERILAFRPHYMVYQTPYDKGHRSRAYWTIRYKRQGIRIVYIPYGIEISDTEESHYKHFTLPPVLNAFRIYVLSEAMRGEYGKHCTNAGAVRALGLPRFDPLCHKERFPLPEEVQAKAGGRKIILWKSHFPKIFVMDGQKLQATPDLGEYQRFVLYIQMHEELFFIFMPHPKYTDEKVDATLRPMALRLLEELEGCANVHIDRADDYRPSLLHADAIIVDRSAVMVEAAAIHCPVLYMYNKDYYEPITPPLRGLMESYESGCTALEMAAFCDRVMAGEDLRRDEREAAVRSCLPPLDGRIGERIKEDLLAAAQELRTANIVEVFREDTRLVLFGCGNIARYLDRQLLGCRRGTIVAYADNDSRKQGKRLHGAPVVAPGEIPSLEYDYVVIVTEKYYFGMYRQLADEIGIPPERIMNYDQYMILCEGLLLRGQDMAALLSMLSQGHDLLADKISRDIYAKRMEYAMTGKYSCIEELVRMCLPKIPPRKRGGMEAAAAAIPDGREFILYGAGDEAEKCMRHFVELQGFAGFCDRDARKQQEGFHGYPVTSPERLAKEHPGAMVLVSTLRYGKEIAEALVWQGIPKKDIFQLAPYMYRQWGNLYFGMQFVKLGEDELFVDVGATALETTLDFLSRTGDGGRAIAVEPDPGNYRKCVEIKETQGLSQVELHACAAWAERGSLLLDARGSGLSSIGLHGATEVQGIPLDEILAGEQVTFLKIDVNGAELEALRGAEQTIRRCLPRIAVAAYHKPEDLLVLPAYLAAISPRYKLYLRHHSNTSAKTVLYGII